MTYFRNSSPRGQHNDVWALRQRAADDSRLSRSWRHPVNPMTEGVVKLADTRRLPGPNADIWDWQLHAACRGMASSYFFHPEGERGPARARRETNAKAVCQECPALMACRKHALQVHEPYGIWGGMSEGERHHLQLNLSVANA